MNLVKFTNLINVEEEEAIKSRGRFGTFVLNFALYTR